MGFKALFFLYLVKSPVGGKIGVVLNEDECIIAVRSENKKGELKRQSKFVSK